MRTLTLAVSIAVVAVALGCHRATQQAELTPRPNAHWLTAERARQDSIARVLADRRAQAERDSLAALRRADSLTAIRVKAESAMQVLSAMIHFDFDKASLHPEDAALLDQKIPILQATPGVRIRIAGNCDGRGSDEYNLALGNRRAITAKQYLVNHGIAADRIETVSFGKEQPVDPGHNALAWAKDRNDQFIDLNTSLGLRTP